MMSVKELRRVHVIRHVIEQQLTQVKAGALLGLDNAAGPSPHRAGRAGVRRRTGASGAGQPSNRRMPEPVKATVLRLYERRYGDFEPTLAAEKLAECHGITLSAETLRQWLRARGIDHFMRRKRPHRAWRVRRAHRGELVQLDGSHHDWFEGRLSGVN